MAAVEQRKSLAPVLVPENVGRINRHNSAPAPVPAPALLSVTETSLSKSESVSVSVCAAQKARAEANCRTAVANKLLKSVSVSSSIDPVAMIQGKRSSPLVGTEQSKTKSQERALKKHRTIASNLVILDQTTIEQTTTTNRKHPKKNGRMGSNGQKAECRTLTQIWDKKGAPDPH